MTVLPSSGEVAFFCDPGKYRTIMVYQNGWRYKSIAPPCDHIQSVDILGVKIGRKKEYLAGSCAACGTIKLRDLENSETNKKWVTVFQAAGEKPRKMFQGEDFTVMVFMCKEEWDTRRTGERLNGSLWELRISDEDEFTLIKKTTLSNVTSDQAPMCYVPLPYVACVYKTHFVGTIKAVSVYTDKLMWQSPWRSPTRSYNVESISYSREHQKILVLDGSSRQGRVFVLDPREGFLIQTITLGGIAHTKELQVSGDYMVAWHHNTMAKHYQVSYLSALSTTPPSPPSMLSEATTPQRDVETYLLRVAAQTPTAPPRPATPSLSSSWSLSSLSNQPPAYDGVVPQPSASTSGSSPQPSSSAVSAATTVRNTSPLVSTLSTNCLIIVKSLTMCTLAL